MTRWIWIVVVSTAAIGCEKKQPRFDGPMPVTFGDCGGTNLTWVSGPRPLAFTQEQAEQVRTAAAERAKPAKAPPPAPTPAPPSTPDEARKQAIDQAREAGIIGVIGTGDGSGGAFASLTGTGGGTGGGFDDANIYGGLLGNEVGEMTGGFGFGPGGGGTGWGTIGTGRYGTIGHGSGTGYGVGGMRGRRVPTISIGQPSATGDLDKAIIRRYIKRNIQKLQYCYEKQLLVKPRLAGTVTAEFTIDGQGKVASSKASGVDPEVADCVQRAISSIEFPKPKGGGVVLVKYPLTFRPLGGAAGPDAGSGSAAVAQDPPAEPPAPPVAPTTKQPAPKPPAEPPPYKPGEHNPLRGEAPALEECLRKNPKPYGALVIELGYGPTGAVTSAVPYGLDGDAAKACVVEIAMKVKRDGAAPAAQRCSLAFGVRPADDGPIIAITADAIMLGGTQVATPQAVLADKDQGATIAPIFDRVKQAVDGSLAPSAPVVAIHGPGVIRPLPTTPIGVVVRVVASVRAAGDEYVLAAQDAAGWRLLRALDGTVPIVPVPVGTGGSWNAPARKPGVMGFDPERVQLSLLVQKERIWIGLSRVNEFQEIPRTGHEWDDLAKKLAEHKQSAFFVDRTDLEIAGEDGVTYGDVVQVIDAASKAGFPWWQLTAPQGLSARPSY